MVLAEDFLEVHAGGLLVLAQRLHRSGAGGRGDVLAVELGDRGDARVGLHRDAHFLDIGGDGEGDILLPRGVVGSRAALQIDGAVLHQRDAVLRGHRLELDLHLGQTELLLDVGQDVLAHFSVEAGVLAVAQRVRQGAGGLAHAERHRAAFLDLGQRVGFCGARGEQGGKQGGGCEQGGFHRRSLCGRCGRPGRDGHRSADSRETRGAGTA